MLSMPLSHIQNMWRTYKTRPFSIQLVPCNFCKSFMICPFCKSILFPPCLSWGAGCLPPLPDLLGSNFPWTPAHMLCHIPVILPQALPVGYWADKCLNGWDKIFATCWEPLLSLYFLICCFISFDRKRSWRHRQWMGRTKWEGHAIQDPFLRGRQAHLFISSPAEWQR